MPENYLAIANIPIQKWGGLYSEEEALNIGTIFEDLNMPFFAAESVMGDQTPIAAKAKSQAKTNEQAEREALMTKINQTGFFLDDLTLYLDTHENDTQAIQLYHEKVNEYAQYRKQFAQNYYPLTRLCIPDCINDNETTFSWQKGPMPWEGACV